MPKIVLDVPPAIDYLQHLLRKIDRIRLPSASRRDVESILVRQVSRELDRLMPGQWGHGRRTAGFALTIGEAAGLMADALHHLKLAAYLHDIGQLALPPFDYSKTFEPDAYAAVQAHPRLGAQILEPFAFLRDAAVLIAHHHERWDGSGYPYGVRGPFIPLGARILAIADAFDAIELPHACSPEIRAGIVYRILRVASGTQFDPLLVELFGRILNGGLYSGVSSSVHPESQFPHSN
ncbi:MAG TPA: HD domain-containing phosphohydrolase [Nitrospira sp.]|nr:HD domain-containing phosphohydrolase [Nitrospira sp.]